MGATDGLPACGRECTHILKFTPQMELLVITIWIIFRRSLHVPSSTPSGWGHNMLLPGVMRPFSSVYNFHPFVQFHLAVWRMSMLSAWWHSRCICRVKSSCVWVNILQRLNRTDTGSTAFVRGWLPSFHWLLLIGCQSYLSFSSIVTWSGVVTPFYLIWVTVTIPVTVKCSNFCCGYWVRHDIQ